MTIKDIRDSFDRRSIRAHDPHDDAEEFFPWIADFWRAKKEKFDQAMGAKYGIPEVLTMKIKETISTVGME